MVGAMTDDKGTDKTTLGAGWTMCMCGKPARYTCICRGCLRGEQARLPAFSACEAHAYDRTTIEAHTRSRDSYPLEWAILPGFKDELTVAIERALRAEHTLAQIASVIEVARSPLPEGVQLPPPKVMPLPSRGKNDHVVADDSPEPIYCACAYRRGVRQQSGACPVHPEAAR